MTHIVRRGIQLVRCLLGHGIDSEHRDAGDLAEAEASQQTGCPRMRRATMTAAPPPRKRKAACLCKANPLNSTPNMCHFEKEKRFKAAPFSQQSSECSSESQSPEKCLQKRDTHSVWLAISIIRVPCIFFLHSLLGLFPTNHSLSACLSPPFTDTLEIRPGNGPPTSVMTGRESSCSQRRC